MKFVALAVATVLLAVVLGQTKTHYVAAVMLSAIHSEWLRHRRPEPELAPVRVAERA